MLAGLLRGSLLTGLYFAGAIIAVSYLRTPADVTLFWPASGIGFAVVLRYGLAYVLTIPLAMLALHMFVVPVPGGFLPFSIGSNTLATLVACWYVRSRMKSGRIHLRTADGLLLLRGGLLLSRNQRLHRGIRHDPCRDGASGRCGPHRDSMGAGRLAGRSQHLSRSAVLVLQQPKTSEPLAPSQPVTSRS